MIFGKSSNRPSTGWEKVFAWLPEILTEPEEYHHKWAWLETIERKHEKGYHSYKYRAITKG